MTEDDPVVQEIPVSLCKALAKKLYLFQYPVHPMSMTYDDFAVLESRIKPRQQQVEIEFLINTHSANYDQSKGEQIALNVDGTGAGRNLEEHYFNSKLMDKQMLCSSQAVTDPSRYAVGLLQDGELHLSPLTGILHLRPGFSYLDRSDRKGREEARDAGEAADSQDEDEEVKQVTVKFARQESDRAKKAREKSFGYLEKKRAEEPWFKTHFHHYHSEACELERNKLFCARPEEEIAEMNISVKEYMKFLIPTEAAAEPAKPNLPTNVLSLTQLRTMPLGDQIKMLLINAKLTKFSQLMSLLAQDLDPMNVLRVLQQVALLVQGNWVVRSDVLYPKDTVSRTTGTPSEVMCKGRDYVLYLFTQSRFIDRKTVTGVTRLPPEEIKEILEQVSRLQANRGWEFLLPLDYEFVQKYPEVVQRQNMLWDAKQQQFGKAFKASKSETSVMSPTSPSKQRRRRTKSHSCSTDNESGTESTGVEASKCAAVVKQRRNSGLKHIKIEEPVDADIQPDT